MAHDTTADALNMIKNAKRARKDTIVVNRISKLLMEILKIMKEKEAIENYRVDTKNKSVEIKIGNITECKAIKPRFSADKKQIDKYIRRYLPARGIGTMIISTNQGLMTHEEALEKGMGGSLIAYFY
jgi:small subunit ribosomal protein S8